MEGSDRAVSYKKTEVQLIIIASKKFDNTKKERCKKSQLDSTLNKTYFLLLKVTKHNLPESSRFQKLAEIFRS